MCISNNEAVKLVLRMCKGHKPTTEERKSLQKLEELDLSSKQIASLKVIREFTNLRTLNLTETQVSSLDGIGECAKLQSLDLSGTRINDLQDLNGLTNLQKLWLNDTQITSLKGIGGLTNLQELWLNDTQIESLEGISTLTNLLKIDLGGTLVRSLEGLDALRKLQSLELGGTPISSLKGIGELKYLRTLNLYGTRISSLSGLSALVNLEELWLNGTQITCLEGIDAFTNLQSLSLGGTCVASLKGIEGLTNLRFLSLSGTRVSSLEEISGLTNLQSLNLSETRISSLEEVGRLANLQSLDITRTSVKSLRRLESLMNLNKLYISGTSLDNIPRWLVEKNLPFKINERSGVEPGVYMKDVQLSEQPVSLFSLSRELVDAYYYQEEHLPVKEAKVIFLGDGGVGKTYTIYRIEHNGEAPTETNTTPGVSVTQYRRNNEATINFWDFGGQEIMHSMHRCFLTERTCYVVTVSNRWSNVTKQARRWLKILESFAPNSKVILAVNRWEDVPAWDLDKDRLKVEFPNLVEVVEYTATKSKDIMVLLRCIETEVYKLNCIHMNFPKSWMEIMEHLRHMGDKSGKSLYYITREEYDLICGKAKLKTFGDISDWLLEWFNDLGICFTFHGTTKDGLMLLNPIWLTNAVYNIVNNGKKYACQGRITHKAILDTLNKPQICVVKGYSYNEKELCFIVEVMRKYRLSFEISPQQEFVPALCPNVTPDALRPKEFAKHVRCELRYDYLPDSVVHRLMVDYSKRLKFEKCWLKGLCINDPDNKLLAVCDMGDDNDILVIDVYQICGGKDLKKKSPQSFLRDLLFKLEKINVELNIKSSIWISSGDVKATFPLSSLFMAFQQGVRFVPYIADGVFTSYDVNELLEQIYDEHSILDVKEKWEKLKNQQLQTIGVIENDASGFRLLKLEQ